MLRIAAIQSRPVWLDPAGTTARVIDLIERAAQDGAELIALPETFLCGYPFWVCRTNGAAFDDRLQKQAYARYLEAAVELEGPELAMIREAAGDHGVFLFLGVTERDGRAARGSTFCTLVAIHPERGIVGAHRKLAPTHDERLVWARGDGHGLRTHEFKGWRVGGLSCWENWMPQARHALHADGIDIHVSTWPGWSGLTTDITRFIALEGRVYSVAVSGLLSLSDVPADFPMLEQIAAQYPELPFDGGSAIAGPDGCWIEAPNRGAETIVYADAEPNRVREERLMFDVSGHYSRPDVFETVVHRRRQRAAEFDDAPTATGHVVSPGATPLP
ncbi:MAG: nitrilase [Solirubrobacteraceae bacterium]|nr:nitrilase [Solirubrobacteraceae bacterium]